MTAEIIIVADTQHSEQIIADFFQAGWDMMQHKAEIPWDTNDGKSTPPPLKKHSFYYLHLPHCL